MSQNDVLAIIIVFIIIGLPAGVTGEKPACQCRRHKRVRFDLWVQKIPWRRKWHPTPVFLPRKFRLQRSLDGYSPCGRKEMDTTQQLSTHEKTHAKLQFCARKWLSYIKKLKKNQLDIELQNIVMQRFLFWRKLDTCEAKSNEVEYKPKKVNPE